MADERSSHWISTVPEIFYDFLARILPGATTLVMILWAFQSYRVWILNRGMSGLLEAKNTSSAVLTVISTMLISWILGLTLTPLGDAVWIKIGRTKIIAKLIDEYRELFIYATDKGILYKRGGADFWDVKDGELPRAKEHLQQIYQELHEYLKDQRPEWAAVLTKSRAEQRFYAGVAAATRLFLISIMPIIIIAIMLSGQWPTSTRYIFALALVDCLIIITWIVLYRKRKRAKRIIRSLYFIMLEFCLGMSGPAFIYLTYRFHDTSPWPAKGCLAFWLVTVPPVFLLSFCARLGMEKKFKQIWIRHLALLHVDRRDSLPQKHPFKRAS